MKVALL
jgi:hypothetical protein